MGRLVHSVAFRLLRYSKNPVELAPAEIGEFFEWKVWPASVAGRGLMESEVEVGHTEGARIDSCCGSVTAIADGLPRILLEDVVIGSNTYDLSFSVRDALNLQTVYYAVGNLEVASPSLQVQEVRQALTELESITVVAGLSTATSACEELFILQGRLLPHKEMHRNRKGRTSHTERPDFLESGSSPDGVGSSEESDEDSDGRGPGEMYSGAGEALSVNADFIHSSIGSNLDSKGTLPLESKDHALVTADPTLLTAEHVTLPDGIRGVQFAVQASRKSGPSDAGSRYLSHLESLALCDLEALVPAEATSVMVDASSQVIAELSAMLKVFHGEAEVASGQKRPYDGPSVKSVDAESAIPGEADVSIIPGEPGKPDLSDPVPVPTPTPATATAPLLTPSLLSPLVSRVEAARQLGEIYRSSDSIELRLRGFFDNFGYTSHVRIRGPSKGSFAQATGDRVQSNMIHFLNADSYKLYMRLFYLHVIYGLESDDMTLKSVYEGDGADVEVAAKGTEPKDNQNDDDPQNEDDDRPQNDAPPQNDDDSESSDGYDQMRVLNDVFLNPTRFMDRAFDLAHFVHLPWRGCDGSIYPEAANLVRDIKSVWASKVRVAEAKGELRAHWTSLNAIWAAVRRLDLMDPKFASLRRVEQAVTDLNSLVSLREELESFYSYGRFLYLATMKVVVSAFCVEFMVPKEARAASTAGVIHHDHSHMDRRALSQAIVFGGGPKFFWSAQVHPSLRTLDEFARKFLTRLQQLQRVEEAEREKRGLVFFVEYGVGSQSDQDNGSESDEVDASSAESPPRPSGPVGPSEGKEYPGFHGELGASKGTRSTIRGTSGTDALAFKSYTDFASRFPVQLLPLFDLHHVAQTVVRRASELAVMRNSYDDKSFVEYFKSILSSGSSVSVSSVSSSVSTSDGPSLDLYKELIPYEILVQLVECIRTEARSLPALTGDALPEFLWLIVASDYTTRSSQHLRENRLLAMLHHTRIDSYEGRIGPAVYDEAETQLFERIYATAHTRNAVALKSQLEEVLFSSMVTVSIAQYE